MEVDSRRVGVADVVPKKVILENISGEMVLVLSRLGEEGLGEQAERTTEAGWGRFAKQH